MVAILTWPNVLNKIIFLLKLLLTSTVKLLKKYPHCVVQYVVRSVFIHTVVLKQQYCGCNGCVSLQEILLVQTLEKV